MTSDQTTETPEAAGQQNEPAVLPDVEEAQDEAQFYDDDSESVGNAEGIKWRRKLRATEAERDNLAGTVEMLQRQRVESLLAGTNVKPAALWKVTDLAALAADDGTIDPDKVAAAVQNARDQFGIAPVPKGTLVRGVGNQPSGVPQRDPFTDAFRSRRR
jgi:hypothetical protein